MPGSAEELSTELLEFCRSESLSGDGLQEIFERHGCTPNHPGIDNYDFFHLACWNEKVTEEILRCLLEYFSDAAGAIHEGETILQGQGETPLHVICHNQNATLGIVQLLIDASPDSLHHLNRIGMTPLLHLCFNSNADDEVKLEVLNLRIEKCPESVRRVARLSYLPIHAAAGF